MNWKPQPSAIFWIPQPYTGQNLMELVNWKFDETAPVKTVTLTNPETKESYQVEVIDYLGVYDLDKIPDFIARECTDARECTGHFLASLIRKKLPEFNNTAKLIFLQVTKTNG